MFPDSSEEAPLFTREAGPNKFKFLKDLDLTQDVQRKLQLNLSSVLYGNEDVYLTPLGKAMETSIILSRVDKLFADNKDKININLDNLENLNRDKIGPRSIAKPWSSRKSSLLDYFDHQDDTTNSSLSLEGISNFRNLRPLSVSRALEYIKNNTNSGLPFYTRKSKVKEELLNNFEHILRREDPCILFTRTQESGKTRNVWGYPFADTVKEMTFYRPLLGVQSSLYWRKALAGPNEVDRAITDMMLRGRSLNRKFVSIDFSSFDATIGKHLQRKCFDYIASLFQNTFSEEIDALYHRFNTIGIVSPDGVLKGPHGVPSGATFTNEVDSLAQFIIAKNTGFVPDLSFQIQGDDGAYVINETDVESLYSAFRQSGLIVNESKSYVSDEYFVYLQKLYDFEYMNANGLIGGIYSIYRALNRLLYQERYSDFEGYSIKGSDYYSIRAITILENCKYHPLFKDFVKLIVEQDKYSLSFSDDSLTNYFRMISQGQGSSGFLNNQYGDDVRGIKSFETYKIIKEMRP